jgi:hypothetical protein
MKQMMFDVGWRFVGKMVDGVMTQIALAELVV